MDKEELKHKREVFEVQEFVNLFNEKIEIIEGIDLNRETPDFLAQNDAGIIGLELTEYRSSNKRLSEKYGITEEINRLSWEHWDDMGYPPCVVRINYIKNIKFRKSTKQDLVRSIVNHVKHLFDLANNQDLQHIKQSSTDRGMLNPLPNGISRISVYGIGQFKQTLWDTPGSYQVPLLDSDVIQGILTKKNKKLKNYYSRSIENWLIIYSTIGEHSDFDHEFFDMKSTFNSNFNRVFIIQGMRKVLLELKIS